MKFVHFYHNVRQWIHYPEVMKLVNHCIKPITNVQIFTWTAWYSQEFCLTSSLSSQIGVPKGWILEMGDHHKVFHRRHLSWKKKLSLCLLVCFLPLPLLFALTGWYFNYIYMCFIRFVSGNESYLVVLFAPAQSR